MCESVCYDSPICFNIHQITRLMPKNDDLLAYRTLLVLLRVNKYSLNKAIIGNECKDDEDAIVYEKTRHAWAGAH